MTTCGDDRGRKRKVAIMAACSLLLVAAIVAITLSVGRHPDEDKKHDVTDHNQISTTMKAIQSICQPTDYRKQCVESLHSEAGNTTDPKELIRIAFKVARKHVSEAAKTSTTLKELEKDPRTNKALQGCKDLMDEAVEDLERSFEALAKIKGKKLDQLLADIKTWLSASITYQETCLDGFEDTKGEAGEKMKKSLKTSMELSVNAIAMVNKLSSLLGSLNINLNFGRRLLKENLPVLGHGHVTDVDNLNFIGGRLIQENLPVIGHGDVTDVYYLNFGRRLVQENIPVVGHGDVTDVQNLNLRGRILQDNIPVVGHGDVTDAYNLNLRRRILQDNIPVVGHGDVTDIRNLNFRRRILQENNIPVLGHGDVFNYPFWLEPGSRRLLSVNDPPSLNPNIVIAKDGSGNFTTINEALQYIPKKSQNITVIYIKEGVYQEKVFFNRSMTRVFMVGDGASKTRITGRLNYFDGTPTMQTATVSVLGDYFMAKNIGFENSAGPAKHQAVALRVDSDMSIFYNCSMDGYQDTLYTHARRQYYRDCTITGTIDFVFGDGSALFQNCTFMVRKPLDNQHCIVTAQGRNYTHQPTAIVIQNSSIIADPLYYPVRQKIKSYLGRPWRIYSRTIIIETFIDDLIQPQGWLPWEGEFGIHTCYYTEFKNHGPGANKIERVAWKGVKSIDEKEATDFTASKFFDGDSWIKPSGVPYNGGFFTADTIV